MPILEWAWGPDTPIRVLDPKMKLAGKERGVKEGRVWVYVRDDRPLRGLLAAFPSGIGSMVC
jgi:hypothetical protein